MSPTAYDTLFDIVLLVERPDDDDCAAVSTAAVRIALDVWHFALQAMGDAAPYGSAVPDCEGGLRIECESTGRHVRVLVSLEGDTDVYFERGERYGINRIQGPADLVSWLRWMVSEEVPS